MKDLPKDVKSKLFNFGPHHEKEPCGELAPEAGSAVSLYEWDRLDEISRQFLRDAEEGGMRYLCENSEVCAWGPAIAGIFSMQVHAERHSVDGWLVTLPNDKGQR